MKKLVAFVLTVICLISLVGCNAQEANSISEYLTQEDGKLYLILPISKTEVQVHDNYEQYLGNIDIDWLKTAEEKISSQIPQDASSSGFYLQMDEGHMYLCVEIIENIDPPETVTTEDGYVITSGCNIDHKHVYLSECITK